MLYEGRYLFWERNFSLIECFFGVNNIMFWVLASQSVITRSMHSIALETHFVGTMCPREKTQGVDLPGNFGLFSKNFGFSDADTFFQRSVYLYFGTNSLRFPVEINISSFRFSNSAMY